MLRQKKPQNRPKQTPAQIVLVLIGTLVTYLLVTGCVFYALHACWQWQYSRELGEIRRRGEPVTPADLRKPPIPESQNAAPMILEALRKLDDQLTRDDTERLIDIASGALTGPEAARQAGAIVGPQRWRIPLVREALRRPLCRFPVDWESGMDASFTHASLLRRMSYVLLAEAVRHSEQGRQGDAMELLSLQFDAAQSLAREPGMISQLCRYGMLQNGTRTLRAIVARHRPPDANQGGRSEQLKEIDLADSVRTGSLGERVMGIVECEQFARELTGDASGAANGQRFPTTGSIMTGAWLHMSKLKYLRHAQWVLSQSRVPYRNIKPEDLKRLDDVEYGLTNFFVATLSPWWGMAASSRDTTIADLNQAIIAIDLELYRRQHGGLPKALEDLRVTDPTIRLEDPFSGKPMRYQKTSGGYRMWSIGQNLRDDGGKPGKQREEGDIVWEVNLESGSSPE